MAQVEQVEQVVEGLLRNILSEKEPSLRTSALQALKGWAQPYASSACKLSVLSALTAIVEELAIEDEVFSHACAALAAWTCASTVDELQPTSFWISQTTQEKKTFFHSQCLQILRNSLNGQ